MSLSLNKSVPIFYPQGINMYVPKMSYAADLVPGQASAFSLGTPAASDDDIIAAAIDADAVATTVETYETWVSDSPYGRNLILTISGNPGNSHAIDVFGEDYLGQPMVERFTGASGVTSILYGKKAFYRNIRTKIVTAASNAVTAKLGTGTRLGLPFKGDIQWARENDVFVPVYNRPFEVWVDRSAAKAVAGGSEFIRAPFPGYVSALMGVPNGGGSTNDPVVTLELGGTAVTGLTVTVDTSDATGLTVTDVPTTPGYSANNRFVANGLIEIVAAAAASAGSDRLGVELTPTQCVNPVLTDPQTTTTGDPRGTYESLAVLDGVKQITVGLIGDNTVNASGNGGLHGIQHVVA